MLACAAGAWADQSWVPGPGATEEKLKPGPGEIAVDQAVAAARAFFPKLGLDVPGGVPEVERGTWRDKSGGDVFLTFGSEATVLVDAKCGDVKGYHNTARELLRWNRDRSVGPQLLNDTLSAQNYAWSVMKRIGLPEDCKLVELQCRFAADPPGRGNDPGPEIQAEFQPKPFGFELRQVYGRRWVLIDPADGALISYGAWLSPPLAIESHDAQLRLSHAQAIAAPVVEKYSVGQQGTGPFAPAVQPSTDPSELMLVLPNGELGGVEYDPHERPVRLRLAWVLHYSDYDEVWIDAADGRVLGGHTLGEDNLAGAKALKRTGMGGP
jgi:hypothetical protein